MTSEQWTVLRRAWLHSKKQRCMWAQLFLLETSRHPGPHQADSHLKSVFSIHPNHWFWVLIFVILWGNPDDDGIRKDGGSVDRTSIIKAEPRYGLFWGFSWVWRLRFELCTTGQTKIFHRIQNSAYQPKCWLLPLLRSLGTLDSAEIKRRKWEQRTVGGGGKSKKER